MATPDDAISWGQRLRGVAGSIGSGLSDAASWTGKQLGSAATGIKNYGGQVLDGMAQNAADSAATATTPNMNNPAGLPGNRVTMPAARGVSPQVSVNSNVVQGAVNGNHASPLDGAARVTPNGNMDPLTGRSLNYTPPPAMDEDFLAQGVPQPGVRPPLDPRHAGSSDVQNWARTRQGPVPNVVNDATQPAAAAENAAAQTGRLRGVWNKLLPDAAQTGSKLGGLAAMGTGSSLADMAQNGMSLGNLVGAGLGVGTALGRRVMLNNPVGFGVGMMAPKTLGDDSMGRNVGMDANGQPLAFVPKTDGIGSGPGGISSPAMNGKQGPYPATTTAQPPGRGPAAASSPAATPAASDATPATTPVSLSPPTGAPQQIYQVKNRDGSISYTNDPSRGGTKVALQQPMVGKLDGPSGVTPLGDDPGQRGVGGTMPMQYNSLSDPEAGLRNAATANQLNYVSDLQNQLKGAHLVNTKQGIMQAINGAGSNLASFTGQGVSRANSAESSTVQGQTALMQRELEAVRLRLMQENNLRNYGLGVARLDRDYGNDRFTQLQTKQEMLDKEVAHGFPAKVTGPDGKTQIDNPEVSNFYNFLGHEGLDLRNVDPDRVQKAVADARDLYKNSNNYKSAAEHDSAIHKFAAKYGLVPPIQTSDGPIHTVGVHKAGVLEGLMPGSNVGVIDGLRGTKFLVGDNGAYQRAPDAMADKDTAQVNYDDLARRIATATHPDGTPLNDAERQQMMDQVGLPYSAWNDFAARTQKAQKSRGVPR